MSETYPWEQYPLHELEARGIATLGRGNIISKRDIQSNPGGYPIYSSSAKGEGLFGNYGDYMFDEEMITWSVDGGGNLFYRPRHRFSVTNVSGYMRLDTSVLDYRFAHAVLALQHSKLTFDYQTKAHPSVIRNLYHLPIPPLPEQKKIAEILSGIDKEISRHQEKIEALRFLKKSTADALIHQERFSLKPLQEVIGKGGSIQDGDWIESKDQDQNGNIRLVQLADIQEGHFMQKSSRFMNQEKANALNVTLLQEGDLLVARMPDPIGRSCIFPGSTQDCVTVVDIAILRSNECNLKWLMHTINTSAVRNQIEELATGTTRKRISRGRLSELYIPHPEKTEQEYIAEQISSIDTALATLQNCIEKTKLLRSAISSDLLSGRKRVSV